MGQSRGEADGAGNCRKGEARRGRSVISRWSMNQAKKDFLSLATLPARLLGFSEHDIPVLVSAGLLKPLHRPPSTSSRFSATVELQALRNDTPWLAKASDAIVNDWRTRNSSSRIKVGIQQAIAA